MISKSANIKHAVLYCLYIFRDAAKHAFYFLANLDIVINCTMSFKDGAWYQVHFPFLYYWSLSHNQVVTCHCMCDIWLISHDSGTHYYFRFDVSYRSRLSVSRKSPWCQRWAVGRLRAYSYAGIYANESLQQATIQSNELFRFSRENGAGWCWVLVYLSTSSPMKLPCFLAQISKIMSRGKLLFLSCTALWGC